MKKKDIINKLAALGVKDTNGKTVSELRKMLTAAQHDTSKPGAYIGKEDIASSSARSAKPPRGRK